MTLFSCSWLQKTPLQEQLSFQAWLAWHHLNLCEASSFEASRSNFMVALFACCFGLSPVNSPSWCRWFLMDTFYCSQMMSDEQAWTCEVTWSPTNWQRVGEQAACSHPPWLASAAVLEPSPLWMSSVFSSGFDPSAGTVKSIPAAMILTTGFTVFIRSLVKALENLILI